MKVRILLFLLFILGGLSANAQSRSCVFTLELYDTFGDGWNNAFLTVTINGVPTIYTLDGVNDNGFFRAFSVEVSTGDTVTLRFTSGGFDGEIAYAIYNPERILVFSDGPRPIANINLTAIVTCPACLAVPPASVRISNVRARVASLSWARAEPGSIYLLEYGTAGFQPGNGTFAITTDTITTLRNLEEKTAYNFYLSAICASGDTSRRLGPFAFETLWANDVGISAVLSPATQCGLGLETVTIKLENFGGDPQSLIPFRYSVNAVDAGVPIPTDGFYTGVLGKDSSAIIEFETQFNFSNADIYIIQAWAELEEDSDRSNDTSTLVITSIPTITDNPYIMDFERWTGGWTVADNSQNPSWAFGRPSGTIINRAASGSNAWVTNLSGNYNNNELSYLLSPCLDFSNFQEDPRLTFSLHFNSESCCDQGWVEVSTNGGTTWRKVGRAGTGINWYNNVERDWWSGTGGFDGWATASNILEGTAGKSDVRIRFVMSSDFSVGREGMGIDNIFIATPLARDLATLKAENINTGDCGNAQDRVRLTISNFGTSVVAGFNVSYQVNNSPIVTENVGTLSIMPGTQATYIFNTPFSSITPGVYNLKAWATAPGDLFIANDTATVLFMTAMPTPYAEDFESGRLPQGWTAPASARVEQAHGSPSRVLYDILSTTNRVLEVTSPAIGPLMLGDSLTFEYRMVNVQGNGTMPKVLTPGDSIQVQLSTDCGNSYTTVFTINADNHTPSIEMRQVVIRLDNFVNQAIKIRIRASWGAGSYFVDLDNFNIIRCPPSLALSTESRSETAAGVGDGFATVEPGNGVAPFRYAWSNGSTDKTAVRLSAGTYTVTVTDRFGCREIATVVVGTLTSTDEPLAINQVRLMPNPTTGQALLQLELREAAPVQVQVFNMSGQRVLQTQEGTAQQLSIPLDLSGRPAGLYLVRLLVKDQVHTEKLLKTN